MRPELTGAAGRSSGVKSNILDTRRKVGRAAATALCVLALSLALAGCDDLPRDPEGTTEQVRDSGRLRAGIIATGNGPEEGEEDLAGRIAAAQGAETEVEVGSAETLLRKLQQGELDVVVGYFGGQSPWSSKVAFTRPKGGAESKSDVAVLRAAVRRGENRWLTQVELTVAEDGR